MSPVESFTVASPRLRSTADAEELSLPLAPKMPAPGGVNANLFALLDDDDDDTENKVIAPTLRGVAPISGHTAPGHALAPFEHAFAVAVALCSSLKSVSLRQAPAQKQAKQPETEKKGPPKEPKERAPKKEGGKGGDRRPREWPPSPGAVLSRNLLTTRPTHAYLSMRSTGNNRGDENSAPYDGSDKPQKPGDGEGRKGGRRRDEEGAGRKGRKGGGKGDRFDRRSGTGRGKG